MAERDAQSLEIGLGHIGQDLEIDGILGKDGRVLSEPDSSSQVAIRSSTLTIACPQYLPELPVAPCSDACQERCGHAKRPGLAYASFPPFMRVSATVRAAASNPSERRQHIARWLGPM